jgi:hypothetical protein
MASRRHEVQLHAPYSVARCSYDSARVVTGPSRNARTPSSFINSFSARRRVPARVGHGSVARGHAVAERASAGSGNGWRRLARDVTPPTRRHAAVPGGVDDTPASRRLLAPRLWISFDHQRHSQAPARLSCLPVCRTLSSRPHRLGGRCHAACCSSALHVRAGRPPATFGTVTGQREPYWLRTLYAVPVH